MLHFCYLLQSLPNIILEKDLKCLLNHEMFKRFCLSASTMSTDLSINHKRMSPKIDVSKTCKDNENIHSKLFNVDDKEKNTYDKVHNSNSRDINKNSNENSFINDLRNKSLSKINKCTTAIDFSVRSKVFNDEIIWINIWYKNPGLTIFILLFIMILGLF